MKYLMYVSGVLFLVAALNKDVVVDPNRELQRVAILANENLYSQLKVELLMWVGVDPLYKGYSGYSCIEWALNRGHFNLAKQLATLLSYEQRELLAEKFRRVNVEVNFNTQMSAALITRDYKENIGIHDEI